MTETDDVEHAGTGSSVKVEKIRLLKHVVCTSV